MPIELRYNIASLLLAVVSELFVLIELCVSGMKHSFTHKAKGHKYDLIYFLFQQDNSITKRNDEWNLKSNEKKNSSAR